MTYNKTSKDGAGWGGGGWALQEGTWDRLGNIFGGRSGFFLHQDGGNRGTGGCIGVQYAASMDKIKKLLTEAYDNGQREVTVEVKYGG